MPRALTPEQHLAIYDRHRAGETLGAIAHDLGIHYETARKWARIGRRQGRPAVAHRPRKPIGRLRDTPPKVIALIHELRNAHPTWGIPYLHQQLRHHDSLDAAEQAAVPSVSTLDRYLREHEKRMPRRPLKNQVPTVPLIKQARHAHHLWQMDLKEKCKVAGLTNEITVANVRDIYSSVTVGAEVFELTRSNATLSTADMQQACRACFTDWGLPDILRTDKGTCFLGNMAQSGFPSLFVLWLAGLGIKHETFAKGQVTQNGCVERFNRTYNNLILRDGPFGSVAELRALSRDTLDFLNTTYPCRAGSCEGRAPLAAHPEARRARRPYAARREQKLFSLARVDALLAQFRWQRRADKVGKVSLGDHDYYLGAPSKGRVFDVSFDPTDRSFVFSTPDGAVSLRRPAVGLDSAHITNIRGPATQQPRDQ